MHRHRERSVNKSPPTVLFEHIRPQILEKTRHMLRTIGLPGHSRFIKIATIDMGVQAAGVVKTGHRKFAQIISTDGVSCSVSVSRPWSSELPRRCDGDMYGFDADGKFHPITLNPASRVIGLHPGRIDICTVLLDAFHAMNRISKHFQKSHGGFRPFIACLRDAIFLVSSEDVKLVEEVLLQQGLTRDEIQKKRILNGRSF
ncbi:hypothetical protein DFS34DRAFT_314546 [Phlyctochytrium arcticum]|nr:hypothetical protein DFS34DRAFT_314546 [Phlyctochytrium arcticum]